MSATTLTALGTADAFSSGGRGQSSWLLEDAAGLVLVDLGATALQALARARVAPERIAAVHLTHLHGDHIAGWPFLLLDQLYRARRTAPLLVSGPPGTRARLEALWALCYPDTAQKPLPFAVEVVELLPGQSATLSGRTITALAAQHQRAPHLALSLRLEGPGGLFAFTGDTGPHEGLLELARGARALIAECTDLRAPEGPWTERRHLAWDDWRELLPRLSVRRLLLGHLGEEARAARAAIEAEGRALSACVTVCDDGDRFAF